MNRTVVVIAPHPDDETLGCGGTLLRHKQELDRLHWIIATSMCEKAGFTRNQIEDREKEIGAVALRYGFNSVRQLGFPSTSLDTIPFGDMVAAMKPILQEVSPEVLYVPYRGDVHTDHRLVFDVVAACVKWFRQPSVKRILAYETISETDFAINPDSTGFQPTVFVDISAFLEQKISILELYGKEMGQFPFPRSAEALRALSAIRGVAAGFMAAEAFLLLKEIV